MIEYYKKNFNKLSPGFLNWGAIQITEWLNQFQTDKKISGNLLEIGVHNATFLCLLGLLKKEGEKCYGVDLFPEDSYKKSFANLNKYKLDVELIKMNSHDPEIINIDDNYRFIHIDGDHSYKGCTRDIEFAKQAINECGIIIIDDYYHTLFPEVTESVCDNCRDLYPIVIGANKIWLTKDAKMAESAQLELYEKNELRFNINNRWHGKPVLCAQYYAWIETNSEL